MLDVKRSGMDGRWGRRSPSHTLPVTIGLAAILVSRFGEEMVSRIEIGRALGHSTGRTGTANRKIGSLTHFRLLISTGVGRWRLSPLAMRILRPQSDADKAAALVEAAGGPSLYRQMLSDFGGGPLPVDLARLLLGDQYGVAQRNAGRVAGMFAETMAFSGLLRDGILRELGGTDRAVELGSRSIEADVAERATKAQLRFQPAEPQEFVGASESSKPMHDYVLPVSGGRLCVLQFPPNLAKSDLDRIRQWLDLMESVLIEEAAGG